MKRRLPCLVLAGLAVGLPAMSQDASGPVYHIELIVFRANSAQGGPENWSAEAGAGNTVGEESTSGSSQVGHFVQLLPPAQYQLSDIENRLRSSGAYVPVAHFAWAQTASAWGTRAGFPLQKLGVEVQGLSGNVFLERGQYLHLGVALSYVIPSPPAGLAAGPGTAFILSESRRVRFYERNYYDNPAFGAIALVTPAQGNRPAGR
ncbi:MAG TPA: CsiV family protein [Steroidobacteraceae bacterium]|nr:CsiV family protein [Steroidobacteraceae bacterium]